MAYIKMEWKGMEDGFKAFFAAKERYPDIQLVLFGEPKGGDVPNSTEFHVFPHSDRLRQIYNSLDIFVMPSHWEGFGNAPMEAMACGAACVVTNVGGVPDYTIPGETTIVVPPKRPDKLSEGILALLKDEAKREQIAMAGYQYIQSFTWEKSINQLEKIFQEILKDEA